MADTYTLPKLEKKQRIYILTSEATPISFQLRSRHTKYNSLLFFDGETNRALRYASNQRSCFVDEQDDNVVLSPIIFEDGKLIVPEHDTVLQVFLSELHPDRGVVYQEFDPEADAQKEFEKINLGISAQSTALEMDIADLEAIARVVYRSRVNSMTSSEIKRDMLIYAGSNPERFLELANDSDIRLRNLAVRAVDLGVIGLRDDNTTFFWVDNNEVILKIKFGDNPFTSLASYFKTDEGIDVMNSIMSKLA